jgi:hypothetical protein
MGTFLAISLVGDSKKNTVEKLIEFSESIQGDFKSLKIDDENILHTKVKKLDNNLTSILYPNFNIDFYSCAHFISKILNTSVLTIYIHDDDGWFVLMYNKGYEIARCVSNYEMIENDYESWNCNYYELEKFYNIGEETLKEFLEKIVSKKNLNNCLNQVADFFSLLNLPTNHILSLKSYKPILSIEVLNSIRKPFISLLDLRKTKKYSNLPIKLSENDLFQLFREDLRLIENAKYNAENVTYFLDIESLTLQVFENLPNKEPIPILNFAFSHKMEVIQDFLNK